MRAVLQRVTRASVTVEGINVGSIRSGWLVLLGIAANDTPDDARYLSEKIINIRAFPDDVGHFNQSVRDTGGSVLAVSQFTLYGDCRKGRRPSFSEAAPSTKAEALYQLFVEKLRESGCPVETGRFQAHMQVELCNDGPVTLLLDSKKAF